MVTSAEWRKGYYKLNREKIIEQNRGYYGRTKKELENEVNELYKRVNNLQIIIKGKDQYIEDLRKMINDLKKEKTLENS